MLRYIKSLENKDLALNTSMIPLGSCTMKLNATTEMIPLSWPEFSRLHTFAPREQAQGYEEIFKELERALCEITGFYACSLQPNSGAQGEYAGLMVIRAYHKDRGQGQRNAVLIPSSAHGTNPASAVMAGMRVVVVRCDEEGSIDVEDLRSKALEYRDNLSTLMITYPSTHGVFEEKIQEICAIIHEHGGQVYMDGANMNASKYGILNANYLKSRLEKHYSVLYTGRYGRVAHEFILDLRQFKRISDIEVEDVAKRLMDYGFHAPTTSWPVPGTMMIEPTESEAKDELDRFCDALISIRKEIQEIEDGITDKNDNLLKNAPHTAIEATSDTWKHPYSRVKAVYPLDFVKYNKFWPPVGRIDNAYGDRTLICTCPQVESYPNE